MTMVRDGIKSQSREEEIRNLDVVELLALSCGLEDDPTAGHVNPDEPTKSTRDGAAA
jgi:hypothetical protein